MTRPSDAAIARAFWERHELGHYRGPLLAIVDRARAIDSEAKDAAGETRQAEIDYLRVDVYLEEAGHPENGDARLTLRALADQAIASSPAVAEGRS